MQTTHAPTYSRWEPCVPWAAPPLLWWWGLFATSSFLLFYLYLACVLVNKLFFCQDVFKPDLIKIGLLPWLLCSRADLNQNNRTKKKSRSSSKLILCLWWECDSTLIQHDYYSKQTPLDSWHLKQIDFLLNFLHVFMFLLLSQTHLTKSSHVAFSDALWFTWILFSSWKETEPTGKCNKFTNSSTDTDYSNLTIGL